MEKVNKSFEVAVRCVPSTWIKAYESTLHFNDSVLQANFIREGNFFDGYQTFKSPGLGIIDNGNGSIKNIYELIVGKGNVSTSGVLFYINFTAKKNGSSEIVFDMMLLANETKYLETVNVSDGLVTVDGIWYPPENQIPPDDDDDDIKPPPSLDDDVNKNDDDTKDNSLQQWTGNIIMGLLVIFVIFFLFTKVF